MVDFLKTVLDVDDLAASSRFRQSGDLKDLAVISTNLVIRRRLEAWDKQESDADAESNQIKLQIAASDEEEFPAITETSDDVEHDDMTTSGGIKAFFAKI